MVLAADDVTDAQVGIVRAGRQVIGRHAIAAQEREVLDIRRGFGLLAVDGVAKADVGGAVAGHTEAQHKRLSGRGAPVALGGGKLAHVRIEQPRAFAAHRFGGAGIGRREVAVREALPEDRLRGFLMHGEAFGLAVLLVPPEIEPAQPIEDGIERGLRIAFDVGIVDAQDHGAAVMARV